MSARTATDREERRYSDRELDEAGNRAAEDILARVKAEDEGQRDLLNLQINATRQYLRDPAITLDEVISACYQTDPGEVLKWTQR